MAILTKLDRTQQRLVLLPLLVLTVTFLILAAFFMLGVRLFDVPPAWLAIGCALLYGFAAFLVARGGILNVAALEEFGLTDSLSGLPNRRALHRYVAQNVGEGEEVAIALLDLDGFKQINDAYGHAMGDELINRCADVLRDVCGDDAFPFRLGGDEFAILVDGPIAGNILESTSRRVLERFRKPMTTEGRHVVIGASIGLARRPSGSDIASSELLRRSDVAMYASKRGGKMRCTWYIPEFDRNLEAIREIDEELREAMARGEFRMHYQPLVDATSRRIVAVESLLRWQRPDGKNIGPNVFVPIAEESGTITQLGLWVLRQACTDALRWDGLMLSVNISAAQLRNPEFPVEVGQILEETGFPAERLELEITETCLVLDPVVVGRSLDVIRQFGVSVVLDDFGTGYASIGFLRQFRFEKLKLDRSLITSAEADDGSRAMMVSSISVARAMAMGVTAEGVETEAQADLARAAGCDQIQGWLYYRAMPPAEIDALLEETGGYFSEAVEGHG